MIMTQSRRVLLLGLFAVLVALALADGEETKADSASKANTKIDAYRAWLLENGARMDNLEFTRVARHGITVSPPEDLKRGASLAFIPKELVVTTATILASPVAQHFATESPLHQAALWLLEQRYAVESFWKPFIDILPRKLTLTMFWDEEELKNLQPMPVYQWTQKRLETIKTKYRALFLAANRKEPLPEALDWMDKVTEAEWKWALGILWSRGLPTDPKYEANLVLVPIEEMFTIMNPTSVEPHVRTRMTPEGIEFVSNTDIPKGSVIEKLEPAARTMSTPQLSFQYGVVFETNKNDRIMLPSCAYRPSAKLTPKHKQLLKSARCDAKEFALKHGNDLRDFMCAARIAAMDETEIANSTLVSRAQGRRMVSPYVEHRASSCLVSIAGEVRDSFYPMDQQSAKQLIEDDKFGYKALPAARRRSLLTAYHAITTSGNAYWQGQRLNKRAASMINGDLAFPPIHETIGRKLNPDPVSDFPADDAKSVTALPLSLKKRQELAAKERAEKRAKLKEQKQAAKENVAPTENPASAEAPASADKDEL